MSESLLWVEKYQIRTIEDCILPESIKKTLRCSQSKQNTKHDVYWNIWYW